MSRFAFFDFDGTISRGDSILPFLTWCIRKGYAPAGQFFKAAAGYIGQRVDPNKVCRAKEKTLSFLVGKTETELNVIADGFWMEELIPHLFGEGIRRMEELQRAGYTIVIVSASPSCYMSRLPEYLPADEVICTACEMKDGRFTGTVSVNCKGEEKVRLINAWLQARGLEADFSECHAYGDSLSDIPMLKMTGHPVMVCPTKPMRQALPEAEVVLWH